MKASIICIALFLLILSGCATGSYTSTNKYNNAHKIMAQKALSRSQRAF